MKQILLSILISFWAVQASFAQPVSSDMRVSNDYEEFYNKIAVENNVPDLCEKISPKAYAGSRTGQSAYQVWYKRSECFYMVAQESLDETLCDNVVTINWKVIGAFGSQYSQEGCLNNVAKWKKFNSDPDHKDFLMPVDNILPKDALIHIFSEMGYTQNTMPDRYKKEIYNTYDDLSYDPKKGIDELIENVKKLPDFN